MNKSIIRAENLHISYRGITALRGVSLELPRGATVLIGSNGSGKTTLLRAIAGLVKPSAGWIRVFGLNPYREIGKLSKKLLYIPEEDIFPSRVKLKNIVELLAETYGLDDVKAAVKLLGLEDHLDKNIGQLSQGLRRRTSLLEAIVSKRDLVLLDEPFRGLDKKSRSIVSRALGELVAQAATRSIIVSSHLMPLIDFDYTLVLEDGKLVYAGSPGELEPLGCIKVTCNDKRIVACKRIEIERLMPRNCRLDSIVC